MGLVFAHRNLVETPGVEIAADSEAAGLGVRSLVTLQIADVWRSGTWAADTPINLYVTLPEAKLVRLIVLAAPRDGLLPPDGCAVQVTGSAVETAFGAEPLNTGAVAFSMVPHGLWAILLPEVVTVRWLHLRFLVGAEEPPLLRLSPAAASAPPAGLTVARGHSPSTASATRLRGDGVWEEVAQNVPRGWDEAHWWNGTPWWLLEPTRTNLIRNARFEGGVAGQIGSGGAYPTHMSGPGTSATLTTTLAFGVEFGLSYMEVRLQTAGATSNQAMISFESSTGIPFTGSAIYTSSIGARIVGGSTTGFTIYGLRRRTNAPSAVNGSFVSMADIGESLRFYEMPQAVGASDTAGQMQFVYTYPATGDLIIRFYAPQFEAGIFRTTPILPPVGAPQAATRGAETGAIALGTTINAGTLYLEEAVLANAQHSSQSFGIQVDDGSDSNRVLLRNIGYASTPNVRAGMSVAQAGAQIVNTPEPTFSYDDVERIVGTFEGDRFRYYRDGALAAEDLSGTSPSMNRLHVASGESVTLVRDARVYDLLSDEQALALSSAGSTAGYASYDEAVAATPNPGYLQLGRIGLFNPIVTTRNPSYGWARGGVDSGSSDRAPLSATRYGRHGAVARRMRLPLAVLTEEEGKALHDAFLEVGTTGQVFVAAFENRLSDTGILGSLAEVPDLDQPFFARAAATLNIVEDR